MSLFKRHSVTLLNKNWETLVPVIKVKHIPRAGEVIFLNDKYFRVLNVVHYLLKKHGIFIIIEELGGKPNEIVDK